MFIITNESSSLLQRGVELHDGWLRVHFAQGLWADFHFRWLRHNCDLDRHPVTGERTLCSSELRDDVRPLSARIRDEKLVIEWAGEARTSEFSLWWLRENAYAPNRKAVPPPPSELATVLLQQDAASFDDITARALALVRQHGVAVVRRGQANGPPEAETEALISGFEGRGLGLVGTHFGRIEDLRTDNTTNQNTDQLGYTDSAVDLHTDQPFLERPPRYQLLQAIKPAARGGESYIVDARAAYRYLASLDAGAASQLTSTPVRFHRKQAHFEAVVDGPLVVRDGDDFFIRFSYFTLAPHRLPFDQLEAFYRAHDRFARIVRNPQHQLRLTLGPGDWLIYDNHRMLHARTAFTGARWLRGIYFDELASRPS